jgi:hypothetical protein
VERVRVTNDNGFWIWWLRLLALLYNYSQLLQLTITLDLRGLTASSSTIDSCKRPLLFPINLQQGPHRNKLSFVTHIVIDTCLQFRCLVLDVCYFLTRLSRKTFTKLLPSNEYPRYNTLHLPNISLTSIPTNLNIVIHISWQSFSKYVDTLCIQVVVNVFKYKMVLVHPVCNIEYGVIKTRIDRGVRCEEPLHSCRRQVVKGDSPAIRYWAT